MDLSEREHRELADIEGRLERDDIRLAERLRTMSPPRRAPLRGAVLVVVLAVSALVMVLAAADAGGRPPAQNPDIYTTGYTTSTATGLPWFPY